MHRGSVEIWATQQTDADEQLEGIFIDLCHLNLPTGTLGIGVCLKAREGMKYLTSLHVRSL